MTVDCAPAKMKRDAGRNVLKRRKRKKLKQPELKPGTEENGTEQKLADREPDRWRVQPASERWKGKERVDEKTANAELDVPPRI